MPRGGHARVGPVMMNADERKLRGSRTRAHHRAAEHTKQVQDEIERELAQNLADRSSTSDSGDARRPDDRPGQPLATSPCDAPDGLSEVELKYWEYYAPKLKAQRRLTMLARDTLAGYCSALAVIHDLRIELAQSKTPRKDKVAARRELRQYLAIKRLYENDLLLNPATATRGKAFDDPPPLPGAGDSDPFDDEFDDSGNVQ